MMIFIKLAYLSSVTELKYTTKFSIHTEHDNHDGEQLSAMNSDERRQGLWGMQFQK